MWRSSWNNGKRLDVLEPMSVRKCFGDNDLEHSNKEEHFKALRIELNRLQYKGVILSPDKNYLSNSPINYLAFLVNGQSAELHEERVMAVRNIRPPRERKSV